MGNFWQRILRRYLRGGAVLTDLHLFTVLAAHMATLHTVRSNASVLAGQLTSRAPHNLPYGSGEYRGLQETCTICQVSHQNKIKLNLPYLVNVSVVYLIPVGNN